jgi:hypothetical protein
MFDRLRFWILDHIGKRDCLKTYIGHGDYTEEPGWWIGEKFIPVSRDTEVKK